MKCQNCHSEIPSGRNCCPKCGRHKNYSPAYGAPKGQHGPKCPKCKNTVRRAGERHGGVLPTPAPEKVFANPPWNAGWKGACEDCGHVFEVVVNTECRSRSTRRVVFRPGLVILHDIDNLTGVAGLELVVAEEKQYLDSTLKETRLTLTRRELEELLDALRGELSILEEHFDWTEDWT